MDKSEIDAWLARYVDAWKSNDRTKIGALFADDIAYRYHPYDEPVRGRDEVVACWLGEGDHPSASTPDPPGTYDASYRTVAVDGDLAVAIGSTTYFTGPGGSVSRIYDNCYVMSFDGSGRCREFTEWFMQRPEPSSVLRKPRR